MTTAIPPSSALYSRLADIAASKRIVVFAGLPGVGKSLLLQQFALIARDRGRRPHSFQWDVVRTSFETPDLLARFPEVNGFTHPGLMALVGDWLRHEIARWHEAYPQQKHILIGEAALVGGRLMELVQPATDESERLLASPDTLFVLPIPSREVRAAIEQRRERTSTAPLHARERGDARPNVLRGLWEEAHREAARLGLTEPARDAADIGYDPDVYRALYLHWLRHRNVDLFEINAIFPVAGSVYDVDVMESELRLHVPDPAVQPNAARSGASVNASTTESP